MKLHYPLLAIVLLGFLSEDAVGQIGTAFPSLVAFSRSLTAGAMGEQGVAHGDPFAAMQYNPANLVSSRGAEFSYLRTPGYAFFWDVPLVSACAAMKLNNGGAIGLEYTYLDYGEVMQTDPSGPEVHPFHSFERSIAAGYAMPIGEELAVGAHARYVWSPTGTDATVDHLLLSAGLTYKPASLSKRLTAGLSLMNFGTRVEYPSATEETTFADPPPANLNLGVEVLPVSHEFFDVVVSLGATKPFDRRDGAPSYNGRSSFSSLFTDWKDFPNDMTAQIGLSYLWHPLNLGGGVNFVQEMDLGYFTIGPKTGRSSYFTHGISLGLEAFGMRAMAGYYGRWHNNDADSFLPQRLPWETVQFSLSSDLTVFDQDESGAAPAATPRNIILSAGTSLGLVVGKMKDTGPAGLKISFDNNTFWSLEADFYIDEASALVSSFSYTRMNEKMYLRAYPASPINPPVGIETLSLEAGFRYHPLDDAQPLFVQGSLGIIRMNPVPEDTWPRYSYQAFDRIAVGCVVPLFESGVVLIPRAGLTSIFMNEWTNASRLGGYHQWEFGMNVGYEL